MFGLTLQEIRQINAGSRRTQMALAILTFVAKTKGGVTCSDSLHALKLGHQSGSSRFSELVRAGCLVPVNGNRVTVNGGIAKVYEVSPTADFHAYLNLPRNRGKVADTLSPLEKKILDNGKRFLIRWRRNQAKGKEKAAEDLLSSFIQLAADSK